jgi:multidrug efflux system membrane fusion protein
MAKRIVGGLSLVLCLALLTMWRLDGFAPAVPKAKADDAPPGVPVTAGVVTVQNVPQLLQGIGTVQAFNTVTVKSRVDGAIVKVAFTEGQEVKIGDLLFQIDPRPYQAALAQATATREKDAAQLSTARMDMVRYGRLVGSGFQTRQSFEDQQGLVAQYEAAVRGDEAHIDTANVNLDYTDIRSPIDGRLGARLVDIGNIVHAADNIALVNITQLKPIFVSFTLPQGNLDEIRPEQRAAPLEVDALGSDGQTVLGQGRLTLIDNMIDQATGTIHLKATFPNPDERLWPGEFVNLRVVLRMQNNVATVPAQTVQDGPDGHYVYIIDKDDNAQRREVSIAPAQNGFVIITKGLTPGERVVVEGQYRLTNGAHVRLLPPKTAAAG